MLNVKVVIDMSTFKLLEVRGYRIQKEHRLFRTVIFIGKFRVMIETDVELYFRKQLADSKKHIEVSIQAWINNESIGCFDDHGFVPVHPNTHCVFDDIVFTNINSFFHSSLLYHLSLYQRFV